MTEGTTCPPRVALAAENDIFPTCESRLAVRELLEWNYTKSAAAEENRVTGFEVSGLLGDGRQAFIASGLLHDTPTRSEMPFRLIIETATPKQAFAKFGELVSEVANERKHFAARGDYTQVNGGLLIYRGEGDSDNEVAAAAYWLNDLFCSNTVPDVGEVSVYVLARASDKRETDIGIQWSGRVLGEVMDYAADEFDLTGNKYPPQPE